MFRKSTIIAIIFGFVLFSTGVVYSQEKSALEKEYEAAFDVYQLIFDDYKSAHEDYVLARSQYQRFQTLTSQNNARNATIRMLEERDEVTIKYLEALKKKLISVETIESGRRDRLISQIDEEINWFSGHKERLSSAGTLEEVVEDSNEAKERYDLLQSVVFESLSVVPYSDTVRLGERLDENFADTKEIVNQIRAESREEYRFDTEKLERIDKWIFDTESKIERGKEKLAEAQLTLDSFSEGQEARGRSTHEQVYGNMIREITESIRDMKDASLFNKEIMKEIKTK
ncbi:hypothetical protein ACFL2C_03785 [Patescibacteria group bacterium]